MQTIPFNLVYLCQYSIDHTNSIWRLCACLEGTAGCCEAFHLQNRNQSTKTTTTKSPNIKNLKKIALLESWQQMDNPRNTPSDSCAYYLKLLQNLCYVGISRKKERHVKEAKCSEGNYYLDRRMKPGFHFKFWMWKNSTHHQNDE